MEQKKQEIIRLLGRKYTYSMLKALGKKPSRFKELSHACGGEKMRAQRLRELENVELIRVRAKRIGRRAVSIYSLSEKGRKTLRLAENLERLGEGSEKS